MLLMSLMALILLGAPVGFSMILLPTIYILYTNAAPLILIPAQMFNANRFNSIDCNSFFYVNRRIDD